MLEPTVAAADIAQVATDADLPVRTGIGLAGSAIWTFVTTAVLGGILVALSPEYAKGRMVDVTSEPLESVLYGILALLGVVALAVVLFVTLIGIPIALLLLLGAYLLWIFGAVIAYLAIADRLVGTEDGWLKPLLVAGAINGVLVLTGIGGLVSFVIGAAGFGAVIRNVLVD